MATDPNKTVFISYRRSVSRDRAVLIFNHLRQQGYDVFLDVKTIDSGAFDSVILNQIGARTYFVVLIADGALQRCQNEGDWLRREIEEALRLGRNIIPIVDEGVNLDQEMGYLPIAWRDQFKRINSLPWVHYYFDSALRDLVERFLKLPAFPVKINPVSADEERLVQQRMADIIQSTPQEVVASHNLASLDIMPKPFAWVDIPAGKSISLLGTSSFRDAEYDMFHVDDFKIAKYPVTNAQFDVFINHADGYNNLEWWDFSDEAKRWHDKNPQPTHSAFGGSLLPRTNIAWYEAMAFCHWLSDISGEDITLPTTEQWIRAAQGDDRRSYPWGNAWDGKRCNNSASNVFVAFGFGRSKSPTPVTKYENLGDSPFGVVDMVGNVSEWCLDKTRFGYYWALGATWGNEMTHDYFTNSKYARSFFPDERFNYIGFRIARLP
jgi:formylglycine-generating enzyme required for sulfatase activity